MASMDRGLKWCRLRPLSLLDAEGSLSQEQIKSWVVILDPTLGHSWGLDAEVNVADHVQPKIACMTHHICNTARRKFTIYSVC